MLTKRLGIGVLASALKKGLIVQDEMMDCVREAAALNAAASRAMLRVGVHACTNVTGFGLAGHLAEMLDASGGEARREGQSRAGAGRGGRHLPGRSAAARARARVHRRRRLRRRPAQQSRLASPRFVGAGLEGVGSDRSAALDAERSDAEHSDPRVLALFDPQTSGGLLLAVAGDRHECLVAELATAGAGAYTIGEVVAGPAGSMAVAGRHVERPPRRRLITAPAARPIRVGRSAVRLR